MAKQVFVNASKTDRRTTITRTMNFPVGIASIVWVLRRGPSNPLGSLPSSARNPSSSKSQIDSAALQKVDLWR
jgi:hypothetical protein